MTKSKWRGHDIKLSNGEWVYCDNNKAVAGNPKQACGFCGKDPTEEGHDGCLGEIQNIKNACCGHGNPDDAYLQAINGATYQGKYALGMLVIRVLRREQDKSKQERPCSR